MERMRLVKTQHREGCRSHMPSFDRSLPAVGLGYTSASTLQIIIAVSCATLMRTPLIESSYARWHVRMIPESCPPSAWIMATYFSSSLYQG